MLTDNRLLHVIPLIAALLAACDAQPVDDSGEASAPACTQGRWRCGARVRSLAPAAAPGGIGPAELKSAYALDTSVDPHATVALVVAYHYTKAEADLAVYRSNFGLPPCTIANGCLKIVNQNGQASPLPVDSPAGDDWSSETSMDLELASATCPKCKLLLVEADNDMGDGMFVAQNAAAALGATVISNSWGSSEGAFNDGSHEAYLNHPGISIFAEAGDSGAGGLLYPASSPHVIAVGATSLTRAANTPRGWSERAWSGSAGGCSNWVAKPAWQSSTGCMTRAAADVSAVADPSTGLSVYNSRNGGWLVIGGTSATPIVAGIYALTGRGGAGPEFAWSHPGSYFDVTTGSAGNCGAPRCTAAPGWDGPTGLGTPNGAALAAGTMPCMPSCSGRSCGDDGCGGSCGACMPGSMCTAAGQCTVVCAHSMCATGVKLDGRCDACATSICNIDPYCCSTAWDSICRNEVGSVCGHPCG